MKKILVLFVFLFSLGMTAQSQTSTAEKERPIKTSIAKADLPIGASFAMVLYDMPIVTGVVTEKTLHDLPIGVPFILSVNGKVTQYILDPLPPKPKRKSRN